MNSIFADPVARESGQAPDPVTFAAAASQAGLLNTPSLAVSITLGGTGPTPVLPRTVHKHPA